MESSVAEEDHGTMKTNRMLGCVWENCQQVKGSDLLLIPGEDTPRVLCPVWAAQYKSDMDVLERVQSQATMMIKRLEHF